MNANDILFDAGKASIAGGSQRIVPEGDRYRWEQQWMRENSAVSGVIHNDAEDANAPSPATLNAPTQISTPTATQRVMQQMAPIEPPRAAYSAAPGTPANRAASNGITRSALTADPLFAALTEPTPESPNPAVDSGAENSAALTTRYQNAAKQFAVWRADDEIKIAMRLTASEQHKTATITTLRQWLKEAGLKLTSLVINGHEQGQAKPRDNDG